MINKKEKLADWFGWFIAIMDAPESHFSQSEKFEKLKMLRSRIKMEAPELDARLAHYDE